MKRFGFTLIELVVSLALSLVIMTTLFTSFFQLNKMSDFANQLIDNDIRISIINNQLEKDLSSAFIPLQALVMAQASTGQPPQGEPALAQGKQPVQKIFYGINKGENVSVLSFITSNALAFYQKNTQSSGNPHMVRVVYRLGEDKEHKNSFFLTRQEGEVLDFQEYDLKKTKATAYQLADGIKSMTVHYQVPKSVDASKTEDKKIEYETKKEWHLKKNTKPPLLPQCIQIKIVLWDKHYQQEYSYELNYIIQAFADQKELSFKPTATTTTTNQASGELPGAIKPPVSSPPQPPKAPPAGLR